MKEATVYGRMPAQTPEPLPDRDGEPHKVPVEPPPEPPDPNPVRMRGSEAGRGQTAISGSVGVDVMRRAQFVPPTQHLP